MGRNPDRTNAHTLKDDGLDLWDRIKLPYTEAQMEKLVEANHYHSQNRTNFSRTDAQKYYYQAPKFDEEEKPAAEQDDENLDELWSQLRSLLGLDDDSQRYGGRYGYTPGTRDRGAKPKKKEKETNPEQIAHADQDRIDAAFGELMDGVL